MNQAAPELLPEDYLEAVRLEAAALALNDLLCGLMIMGMGGEQHAKQLRKGVITFMPSPSLLLQMAGESLEAADAAARQHLAGQSDGARNDTRHVETEVCENSCPSHNVLAPQDCTQPPAVGAQELLEGLPL